MLSSKNHAIEKQTETAEKYSLPELWDDLEKDYNRFTAKELTFKSAKDKQAYKIAKEALGDMIQLGRAAEKAYMFMIPYYGYKLDHMFENRFVPDKLPDIKGKNSLAFSQEVVLPFLRNCAKVQHDEWVIWLAKMCRMDLEKKKAYTYQEIGRLEAKMEAYKLSQSASKLNKQGLYAVKESTKVDDHDHQDLGLRKSK
jgi:hypothetical protein